jgi:hypothetical protein
LCSILSPLQPKPQQQQPAVHHVSSRNQSLRVKSNDNLPLFSLTPSAWPNRSYRVAGWEYCLFNLYQHLPALLSCLTNPQYLALSWAQHNGKLSKLALLMFLFVRLATLADTAKFAPHLSLIWPLTFRLFPAAAAAAVVLCSLAFKQRLPRGAELTNAKTE